MDLHGKSTRPGLSHTGVSHSRVPLAGSKHDLQACHTGVSLPSPSITLFRKGQF
ncbi:Putative transcription factor SEF1 [Gossypium arboreum]|uniref:Putative transcription factor SEF1 n=1 Tax=Gossypium arboreum TaxID=29729 RepID=A0A0B0MN30_GOSAR|nr:Putative transcription factor SEF1 [Gossypium arboreum]